MKNTSWFKEKKKILAIITFLAIFIFSLDYWGWNIENISFLGLPLFVYYLIFLTLLLSVFFYILSKNIWRDDN